MLYSMAIPKTCYRLLAPTLALLLTACGNTRHATSPRAEELTGFVLILQEETNGQISHFWQRATELDLTRYDPPFSAHERAGSVVLASRRPVDCDQEQIDCFRACMKRRFPTAQNHIRRGDGSKRDFCSEDCLKKYMQCLKLQESQALQFTALDAAIEWLKRNREKLLVGTIVVIAGVAFVTLSAGAGAVVLAPVVLVAA
jgi:hypothetical protein